METATLTVTTDRRQVLVPITGAIEEQVRCSGWKDGLLTVFVPHTTAGVTINENADPDVARDMTWFLEQLVPEQSGFRHAEGNADAHIKASLMGSSVQLILRSGKLWLGTWQGVYLAEFDGPRQREVWLAFS